MPDQPGHPWDREDPGLPSIVDHQPVHLRNDRQQAVRRHAGQAAAPAGPGSGPPVGHRRQPRDHRLRLGPLRAEPGPPMNEPRRRAALTTAALRRAVHTATRRRAVLVSATRRRVMLVSAALRHAVLMSATLRRVVLTLAAVGVLLLPSAQALADDNEPVPTEWPTVALPDDNDGEA